MKAIQHNKISSLDTVKGFNFMGLKFRDFFVSVFCDGLNFAESKETELLESCKYFPFTVISVFSLSHCFTELISCTRHLSVKSTIQPVQSSYQLSAMDTDQLDKGETAEEDEDPHGENCQECKQKVQWALTDTLPPTVAEGGALNSSLYLRYM